MLTVQTDYHADSNGEYVETELFEIRDDSGEVIDCCLTEHELTRQLANEKNVEWNLD